MPSAKTTLLVAMACFVYGEAMGLPGRWWSPPSPAQPRMRSVSVTPTAPTPVSSFTMVASSVAASGRKPRAMSSRERSATLSARSEEAAATRSSSRCRSRSTVMKRVAPIGFMRIMGGPMASTTATARENGWVRSSTIPMWMTSPAKVVMKATRGVIRISGLRFSARWTSPPRPPSSVVATAPASAAAPPSAVTRCTPAVTPTRIPSTGPPSRPARTAPTARAFTMACPPTTGTPR